MGPNGMPDIRRDQVRQDAPGVDNRFKGLVPQNSTDRLVGELLAGPGPMVVLDEPSPVPFVTTTDLPEGERYGYYINDPASGAKTFHQVEYTATPAEMAGKYGYRLGAGEPTARWEGPTDDPHVNRLRQIEDDTRLERLMEQDYRARSRVARQRALTNSENVNQPVVMLPSGGAVPAYMYSMIYETPKYSRAEPGLMVRPPADDSGDSLALLQRAQEARMEREAIQNQTVNPELAIMRAAERGIDPVSVLQGIQNAQRMLAQANGAAADPARAMLAGDAAQVPMAEQRMQQRAVLEQIQETPMFLEMREANDGKVPEIGHIADQVVDRAATGQINAADVEILAQYLATVDSIVGEPVQPGRSLLTDPGRDAARRAILNAIRMGERDPGRLAVLFQSVMQQATQERIREGFRAYDNLPIGAQ